MRNNRFYLYNIVYINVFLIMSICLALVNCYLTITGKTIPGKRGKRLSAAMATFSLGFMCLFIPIMFLLAFTRIYNATVFFFYFLIIGSGCINLVVGYFVLKSEKSEKKTEESLQNSVSKIQELPTYETAPGYKQNPKYKAFTYILVAVVPMIIVIILLLIPYL